MSVQGIKSSVFLWAAVKKKADRRVVGSVDTHNLTRHKQKFPVIGNRQSGRQTGGLKRRENLCLTVVDPGLIDK